jgi:hypothetical protein
LTGQIFARPDYAPFAGPADRSPIIDDEAMELGQLYRSAAVLGADRDLPPALRPDQWAGQPGTRAPHVWVSNAGKRASTLDLVQPGWVLLTQDQRWSAIAKQVSQNVGIALRCELIGGATDNADTDGSPLDLPIERIAADPAGKSELDALLPQVMGHANYASFKSMSLRQLQPVSQGKITDEALASVVSKLVPILGPATLIDPVDPEAFVKAFGIGHQGASLIRPDGYIAWRSAAFPTEHVRELSDAFRCVSQSTHSLSIDDRCTDVNADGQNPLSRSRPPHGLLSPVTDAGPLPPGCAKTTVAGRDAGKVGPKRSAASSQFGVIALVPNVFAAWRRLKARIESAASAFTALSPLVRNLPPPDIRFMVPNGCSTVRRLIVIRLGLAWIRASMRSSAL